MITLRQLFDEVAEEESVRIGGHPCVVWNPTENLDLALAVELPDGAIADLDVAPEKHVNPKTGSPSLVYKLEPADGSPTSLDRATLLRLKEIGRPIFGGYQVDLLGLLGEAVDDEDPHEPSGVVHTGDDELLDRIGNAKGFVDRIIEEANGGESTKVDLDQIQEDADGASTELEVAAVVRSKQLMRKVVDLSKGVEQERKEMTNALTSYGVEPSAENYRRALANVDKYLIALLRLKEIA